MDSSSEYGAPLSNLPPLAWLSGLDSGGGSEAGAMSGDQQPSLGGGAAGTQMPRMEGGLGLDALSELLKAQQGGGGEQPAPGSMFQGIGGTIGQGTLAQGGPGYTIGGGGTVGQAGPGQGGYTAGQTQGDTDPMALIKQALGVAGKVAGAFGKSGGGYESTPEESTSQLGNMGQTSPSGYSLTGAGAPPAGSPEALAQFFSGEFGSQLLNDPTIMQLYTSGKLNGLFGSSNENTLQDFGTGGYSLSGQSPENIFSAPGGTAGFSLGGNTASAGPTNWFGTAGGAAGAGTGLLSLLQSMQGDGNGYQSAGGGIQTASGLLQMLKSSPELAQSLGLNVGALGGVGAGVEGLGAILSMIQGAQSGNASQIGQGAIQGITAANAGLNAAGVATGAIGGVISNALPLIGAVLQGLTADMSYQGADATAKQAMMTSALSAVMFALQANPFTAMIAPVLGVAMAINQATTPQGNTWPSVGGAATAMKEKAVSSIDQANQLASQYGQSGDVATLMQVLQNNAGALYDYFGTTAGPTAPITVGSYYKHMKGEDMSGLNTSANDLMQSTFGIVQRLRDMGITPEQLGQIPIAQGPEGAGWGSGMLYGNPGGGQAPAFDLGQYRSQQAYDQVTGGPFMSMLAQLNPALYGQIGGNTNSQPVYDTWAADRAAELARQAAYTWGGGEDPAQAAAAQAAAQQAFTSGGA